MEQERIPFDIKYRPEIETGELLVVTRDGLPVRIVCWNRIGDYPIAGLIKDGDFEEFETFFTDGAFRIGKESGSDLFLVPNPDYKGFTVEPLEATVWAAMAAFGAKFTNYEGWYQCRVQFLKHQQEDHRECLTVFGRGKTPYEAAVEVYKQLVRGAVDEEAEEGEHTSNVQSNVQSNNENNNE